VAFYARSEHLGAMAKISGIGLGLSTTMTLIVAAVVIGISSMTARRGYVMLTWIGLLFVPMILSAIVAVAADSGDVANLFSLSGNFWLAAKAIFEPDELKVPAFAPFLILLSVGGAGCAALYRRITKLEGVA
jgi:hypothetical protein